MDFEHIHCFLTLAKTHNFSRAAETLHLSQSSVSKRIRGLEQELHTKLFDRSQTFTTLTPAGQHFHTFALTVYTEYEKICQTMQQFDFQKQQSVRLGILPISDAYGISYHLARFQLQYTDIQLDVRELQQSDILQLLNDGQLDFGLIRFFSQMSEKFCSLPLFTDELKIVCSRRHPFHDRSLISLSNLADQDFVMLSPKSEIYQQFSRLCLQHQLSVRIAHVVNRHSVLFNMLLQKQLLTILPEHLIPVSEYPGLISIPLLEAPTSTCGLIYKTAKKLSAWEQTFLNVTRQQFHPHSTNLYGGITNE